MKQISKQEARKKYGICTTGASSLCQFFLREDGCVVDDTNCVRYCPPLAAINPQATDFFYAMGKKARKDVPYGAWYAYRAWQDSLEYKTDMFEAADVPWGRNAKQEAVDFVAALREAGITEIAVTESNSALMESVHALVEAGAELAGTVVVKRQNKYDDYIEERQGLRFKIPD